MSGKDDGLVAVERGDPNRRRRADGFWESSSRGLVDGGLLEVGDAGEVAEVAGDLGVDRLPVDELGVAKSERAGQCLHGSISVSKG